MSDSRTMPTRPSFVVRPELVATEPPEARGLARDEVRLLVATPVGTRTVAFRALADHLEPGDLVVVNTSATLPAAVDGHRRGGESITVHVAGPHRAGDGDQLVELRAPTADGPAGDVRAGEVVDLPGGVELQILSPLSEPDHGGAPPARLWVARLRAEVPMERYLARHGRPIAYAYVHGRWPLTSYQTIFGRHAGSAEMASAARPFTPQIVTDLAARGIVVAPIELHAGVSSQERGEPPLAERYRVPAVTAALATDTRRRQGRVIAVGTTVARALETVAGPDGRIDAGEGWTELVLGPDRPARVVDGIISGWHPPEASHLDLLVAVAGPDLVRAAYRAALREGLRWHEFGDSCLLLPRARPRERSETGSPSPRLVGVV